MQKIKSSMEGGAGMEVVQKAARRTASSSTTAGYLEVYQLTHQLMWAGLRSGDPVEFLQADFVVCLNECGAPFISVTHVCVCCDYSNRKVLIQSCSMFPHGEKTNPAHILHAAVHSFLVWLQGSIKCHRGLQSENPCSETSKQNSFIPLFGTGLLTLNHSLLTSVLISNHRPPPLSSLHHLLCHASPPQLCPRSEGLCCC